MDNYELREESISNEKYRRLENGPAPFFFDVAMSKLEALDVAVEMKIESPGNYSRYRYSAAKEPDMSIFSEEEKNLIEWEFNRLGSKTARELSALSHLDTPWKIAKDKEEIDYDAVFYRTAETSVLDE
jgi:hypothetical protein